MNATKSVPVSAEDLCQAFEWVCAGTRFENCAYICKDDGRLHWTSRFNDVFEEPPDDVEDPDRYIAIPHRNDLDLGRKLAPAFTKQELPGDYYDVLEYFRHKRAYANFRQLLEQRDKLKDWYNFEEDATKQALLEWCELNSIQLVDPSKL